MYVIFPVCEGGKKIVNLDVQPEFIEALESVHQALHDPSVLDAYRNRRNGLDSMVLERTTRKSRRLDSVRILSFKFRFHPPPPPPLLTTFIGLIFIFA